MKLKISFLLGLLILFFLNCIYADEWCDITKKSFNLCKNDAICRRNMYIDENDADIDTFEFLNRWVITSYNLESKISKILCTDYNNDSNTTLYQELWLDMLKKNSYCKDINEYYDKNIGCICRNGKTCHYEPPEKYLFSFSGSKLLTWALLVFLIIFFLFSLHRLDELYKFYLTINNNNNNINTTNNTQFKNTNSQLSHPYHQNENNSFSSANFFHEQSTSSSNYLNRDHQVVFSNNVSSHNKNVSRGYVP